MAIVQQQQQTAWWLRPELVGNSSLCLEFQTLLFKLEKEL